MVDKTKILSLLGLIGVILFIAGTSLLIFSKQPSQSEPPKNSPSPTNQVIGAKDEQSPSTSPIPSDKTQVKVTRVIDGDTIEIEGGQKLRYIGIDTPETVDPRTMPQCFGREASSKNKQLVEGKYVQLEKDVSETDKYGRLLRYIYLDGIFVNEVLVYEGYAISSTYPPDVKYQEKLKQAEMQAREQNRGLWGACNGNQSNSSISSLKPIDPNCTIKGNISSNGEKIYHVQGQSYYDKTAIDESRGERWFCTEEEAQQAGWRKAKN